MSNTLYETDKFGWTKIGESENGLWNGFANGCVQLSDWGEGRVVNGSI